MMYRCIKKTISSVYRFLDNTHLKYIYSAYHCNIFFLTCFGDGQLIIYLKYSDSKLSATSSTQ